MQDHSQHPLKSPLLAICIGLLALMVSGPFLLPFHTQPIASFWSEWWAGALGVAAVVAGFAGMPNRSLALPATLGIPAVLLLAVMLQLVLGRLAFNQVGLLHAAYLIWAGLLLILGRQLAETVGLGRLVGVLASAYALGALLSAGVALTQWLNVSAALPWVFPRMGGGVYANVAQANHYAHYSWLGIASLFYLRGRGWLSRPIFWAAVLPIALGSVASGSRSVFLYAMLLLVAVAWTRRRDPKGVAASLCVDAVALLPVLVVLDFFGSWVSANQGSVSAAAMSTTRLYQEVSGPSIRVALARTAWSAFIEHPWLGHGAGDFAWASFLASARHAGSEPYQVAENAHNAILQSLAEFGAPATATAILLLLMWAKSFIGRPWGLQQFWCATVLGIGAVHALLEYPLWYSNFLGPVALLLGATDARKAISLSGRRVAVYLALVAVAGISILTSVRLDYSLLEAAFNHPLAAHPDRERAWQMSIERLKVLQRESLLSPWALLAFAELAEPSRSQARDRAALCERGIRFSPARSLVTRCAMQLALAGRGKDAEQLVRLGLRAYPAARATTIDELAKGARAFPELVALWELSLRNSHIEPAASLESK